MIKKTLYFGNPAYLLLRNAQLIIRLPEVVDNDTLPEYFKQVSEVSKPIEDIGVIVLDHKQITITSGVLEAFLENNCAVLTCDSKSMPVGYYFLYMEILHRTRGLGSSWMLLCHCRNNFGSRR